MDPIDPLGQVSGNGATDPNWRKYLLLVGVSLRNTPTGRVPLQLREGGHDRQHRRAHGPGRVQSFGEGTQTCSLFPDAFDEVQDVTGVAAQAVELPHGEYVAC